ncbi:MAG: sugar phosphate isomerase/epimerase [Rhodobacteraceae bacterium]|nr:sugar phosphate isomerase/epimerase [Paracoccaceae bacterium]MCY4196953.1 sugar phosphate isomerase/epimerase [Paracoccaceae bacterium]MCY4326757.1 sugar phosphate isomerase/epimerase [Paracoccaceae bacterium]
MRNPIGIISMQFTRPFTGKDLHYFQKAADLGFDFVELLVPEPEDRLKIEDVKSAADAAGIFIVLAARTNLQRSIASADAKSRQGGFDYIMHCVDLAAELGVRIVGGPLYGEPLVFAGRQPMPRNDHEIAEFRERTISAFSQLASYARSANVVLAVEPLNRFETDIISTTNQAVEIVDAVDNPAFKLMLDTFHMNMEDPSIDGAIKKAGGRIAHFQANENHRGYPGTGHIDWRTVMLTLAKVGYQGPISLEPFRRNDDRVALPIAQWRPPYEDEAPMLRAGLELIRGAFNECAGA